MGIGELFLQSRDTSCVTPVVLSDKGLSLFALSRRCLALSRALSAQALLVVVEVAEGGLSRRISKLVFLRVRLALLQRILMRSGLRIEGRFAVFPNVEAPSVIYRLGGAAEQYSREYLVPTGASRLRRLLQTLGVAVSGCDPRAGAVIVIGSRRDTRR